MKTKISEIQILPIKPQNGIVAFASLVLNDSLYLGSIAVMTRIQGGYRLIYPTKKIGIKSFNIYHPICKEFAELIEEEVIKKFEEVMNKNDRYNSINFTA